MKICSIINQVVIDLFPPVALVFKQNNGMCNDCRDAALQLELCRRDQNPREYSSLCLASLLIRAGVRVNGG